GPADRGGELHAAASDRVGVFVGLLAEDGRHVVTGGRELADEPEAGERTGSREEDLHEGGSRWARGGSFPGGGRSTNCDRGGQVTSIGATLRPVDNTPRSSLARRPTGPRERAQPHVVREGKGLGQYKSSRESCGGSDVRLTRYGPDPPAKLRSWSR